MHKILEAIKRIAAQSPGRVCLRTAYLGTMIPLLFWDKKG